MAASLLQLTAITKSFGGVCALDSVSFELQSGEVHALVGENGAGKSTLIKIMTGAVQADSGSIQLGGTILDRNDPGISRRLGIAAIYQQPALFPDLTVAENIALRLESGEAWRVIRWAKRRAIARDLLGRIGAEVSCDTLVRDLTMPQQQIVEIAGALGARAKVLILDEPTSSLTDREVERLFRILRQLKSQGVGMIFISHRMDELPRIADRVTVLRDGKSVGTRAIADAGRAELVRMMVGRELSAVYPKTSAPVGDVILQTKDLGCAESGVHGINLALRSGEILAVAGLVGAGRSELARVLFGLTPADRGEILVRGKSVRIDSPTKAVRLGIAYVPEDRRRYGVILEMPVAANTTLAILKQISRAGLLDFAREREIAGEFARRLGIKMPSVDAPVGLLSGGNQQKVALSRWLATEPAVMILDEPTQGVDVGAKAEIHRLMSELAGRGLAILMISSELPEILGMSDRIAVMRGGSIVGELKRSEATQEKVLELALGHARSEALGVSAGIGKFKRELSVAGAYLALLLVLALAAPRFFQVQFRDTWVSAAPTLVVAIGMTLVIVARHIDISVGSQFSICAVAAGLLAKAGMPMPAVIGATLAVGAAMGALNGALVAGLGLPSIVVTLATMVIFRQSLTWARQGEMVADLPARFQWFGQTQAIGQWLIVIISIAIFIAFAWGARWLSAGRKVYAVGSDQEAARLSGIRPGRVVFAVFVLMGALVAAAALLQSVRFAEVDPKTGDGLELEVIAAVVVGGAAISGGRGTMLGSLAGVALLGAIGAAMVFLTRKAQWDKAIEGVIILAAVASDGFSRRRKRAA